MVHFMRIILAIFIVVVFAVNDVFVDAGKATKNRNDNLSTRASKHEEILKTQEDQILSKYGEMSKSVIEDLNNLNYIIIDHIVDSEQFKLYLRDVFRTLQEYAGGQIESRFESLEKVYSKWEKKNFPDKQMKDEVRNILIEEGKIKADTKKKTTKKSKKSGS